MPRALCLVALFASGTSLAAPPGSGTAAAGVGYNEDLQSVVSSKCQTCHASTPPTLGTYADLKLSLTPSLARIKLPKGDAKLMPKGGDPLDAATLKLFDDWQSAGMPETRAATPGGTTPGGTTPGGTTPGGTTPPSGGSGTKPTPPGSKPGDPTPLILDLGGHGNFGFAGHAVLFDIAAEGAPRSLHWPAKGTAFLAIDRNGNGQIDDGSELFGDATPLPGGGRAADGFAALAAYDANHDGVIDARDPVFSKLVLWTDDNENGRTDVGELKPLLAYGITSLSLQYELIPGLGEDGLRPKLLLGTYGSNDGGVRILADIFLESY